MMESTAASRRMTLLVVALAAMGSGCATFFRPSPTSIVVIESNPTGARIAVDGEAMGQTPVGVPLSRRRANHDLRLEADGCSPTVYEVRRSPSWWILPSVFFSVIPTMSMIFQEGAVWPGVAAIGPFIIDWWNGAVFEFPRRVNVALKCDPESPAREGAGAK